MAKFDPKPTANKSTGDPKVATITSGGKIAQAKKAAAPKARTNYGVVQADVKQCKVCQSPNRTEIEKLIMYGMTQREVIRQFQVIGEKFNKNSMSNHVRKHMSLRKSVVRRIVEAQAQKQFEDIEEVAGTLLTSRGILEVMRQRGTEQIIDGNSIVEPETLLRVMDKLDAQDSSEESEKLNEMMTELNCLLRAVQSTVPEPMWAEITKLFTSNLEQARGHSATAKEAR